MLEKLKSHFKFNKQERSGIFFLLLIIILLQIGYFIYRSLLINTPLNNFYLDSNTQAQIDVLKDKALQKDSVTMYPFNPNYITDYKGYILGMSVEEIDRLHSFRKQNKFANSATEFQKVTSVSDSLLNVISPYFRFPEWTKGRGKQEIEPKSKSLLAKQRSKEVSRIRDLNMVTSEDLKKVYGIGEILSERIIKFRNRLGGFLVKEQLYDVYGLEAEVAERTLQRFNVLSRPDITRINLNKASVSDLAKLVYIRYSVAQDIVSYRESIGTITSFEELKVIEGFPSDKINRLALYLSL